MKKVIFYLPIFLLLFAAFKKKELGIWEKGQLLPAKTLATRINQGDTLNLLIINTGPVDNIKGAITFGAVENPNNLAKLKNYLEQVPRTKEVVIYCGCCPLSVCPNLKPAYDLLGQMKFEQFKVLRLIKEIQEDWIDKGYPM